MFDRASYVIGPHVYSLTEIENGLLRGNRTPPASLKRVFSDTDPRAAFMVGQVDYRIHFALNCGALSCPPLRFYNHEHLDEELELASRGFCDANVVLRSDSQASPLATVEVSEIFKWYRVDFVGSGGKDIDFLPVLQRHVSAAKAKALQQIWDHHQDANVPKFKLRFSKYDWGVNDLAVRKAKASPRRKRMTGKDAPKIQR